MDFAYKNQIQAFNFKKRPNLRAHGHILKTSAAQSKLKRENPQSLLHNHFNWYLWWVYRVSQVALVVKNLSDNTGDKRDMGSIPGVEKIPWRESMAWTHSSILAWRIPMDRGAWRATVHSVAKSQTRLKHLSMYTRWVYKNILWGGATLRERKAECRFPVQFIFNMTQSTGWHLNNRCEDSLFFYLYTKETFYFNLW